MRTIPPTPRQKNCQQGRNRAGIVTSRRRSRYPARSGVNAAHRTTMSRTIPRTASVRLLRDNRAIYEGKIGSLRHFKNDVSEVRQGFECGIAIERFQDVKIGDVIEAFKVEQLAPVLA